MQSPNKETSEASRTSRSLWKRIGIAKSHHKSDSEDKPVRNPTQKKHMAYNSMNQQPPQPQPNNSASNKQAQSLIQNDLDFNDMLKQMKAMQDSSSGGIQNNLLAQSMGHVPLQYPSTDNLYQSAHHFHQPKSPTRNLNPHHQRIYTVEQIPSSVQGNTSGNPQLKQQFIKQKEKIRVFTLALFSELREAIAELRASHKEDQERFEVFCEEVRESGYQFCQTIIQNMSKPKSPHDQGSEVEECESFHILDRSGQYLQVGDIRGSQVSSAGGAKDQEIKELKQKITAISKELQQTKQYLAESQDLIQAYERNITELESQNKFESQKLKSSDERIKKLMELNQEITVRSQQTELKYLEVQSQRRREREEMNETFKEKMEKVVREHEKKVERVGREKDAVVRELEDRVGQLEKQLEGVRQKSQKQLLKQQPQSKTILISSFQQEILQKDTQITQLRKQLTQQYSNMQQLLSTIKQLQSQPCHPNLEPQLQQKSLQIESLNNHILELTQQLQQKSKQLQQSKTDSYQIFEQNFVLQQKIEGFEADLSEKLREQRKSITKQNMARLVGLEEENARLMREVAALQEENGKMGEEIGRLMEEGRGGGGGGGSSRRGLGERQQQQQQQQQVVPQVAQHRPPPVTVINNIRENSSFVDRAFGSRYSEEQQNPQTNQMMTSFDSQKQQKYRRTVREESQTFVPLQEYKTTEIGGIRYRQPPEAVTSPVTNLYRTGSNIEQQRGNPSVQPQPYYQKRPQPQPKPMLHSTPTPSSHHNTSSYYPSRPPPFPTRPHPPYQLPTRDTNKSDIKHHHHKPHHKQPQPQRQRQRERSVQRRKRTTQKYRHITGTTGYLGPQRYMGINTTTNISNNISHISHTTNPPTSRTKQPNKPTGVNYMQNQKADLNRLEVQLGNLANQLRNQLAQVSRRTVR